MSPRFNRHQPLRPTTHPETGIFLLHRTFPMLMKRMPKLMSAPYQITQMRMYRALRRGEFPNHVKASELREWLGCSHKVLGGIILQAVRYEARKVVTRKEFNGSIIAYQFHDLLELEYGLEWMICMWLRNFLTEAGLSDMRVAGPVAMQQALDDLVLMNEDDYVIDYEEPIKLPEIQEKFQKTWWDLNFRELTRGLQEEPVPEASNTRKSPPKSLAI